MLDQHDFEALNRIGGTTSWQTVLLDRFHILIGVKNTLKVKNESPMDASSERCHISFSSSMVDNAISLSASASLLILVHEVPLQMNEVGCRG